MEQAVFWLCGVVNYAGVYFGMITGGFLVRLTRFLFFTADVGGYTRMDADEELLFYELF